MSRERARYELSMTLELLGKVEGLKSYVRRCRADGVISPDEMAKILRPAADIESVARNVIQDRERQYQQLGGVFAIQPDKPALYTRKLVN